MSAPTKSRPSYRGLANDAVLLRVLNGVRHAKPKSRFWFPTARTGKIPQASRGNADEKRLRGRQHTRLFLLVRQNDRLWRLYRCDKGSLVLRRGKRCSFAHIFIRAEISEQPARYKFGLGRFDRGMCAPLTQTGARHHLSATDAFRPLSVTGV